MVFGNSLIWPKGRADGFFDNFISKDRLAEFLGISISHVNKLMTEGLPCLKIGRAVRYRVSDVVMWLQKRSTR